MLKRKMKGVAMEPSPSHHRFEEQARSRKFQSLMQDYNDLFKDAEEKRRSLQIAKRRKRILMTEVRFLRQRYEELLAYKSREQNLVRIQAPQMHHRDVERSRQDREATLPTPAPILDLNQIANDEEEEIEVEALMEPVRYIEPMRTEKKSVKFSMNNSAGKPPLAPRQKDMKLTVCRDIRKGNNRTGKRKISLQDPVALRV